MRKNHKGLSFSQRRQRSGWLFCLPFLIGFGLFFLVPMLQSVQYAFSTLQITQDGLVLKFVGLKNFTEALFADSMYVRTIASALGTMLVQTGIILMFSLFIAIILNQKFRGRTLARVIFFLPVIIMSGAIIEILSTDYLSSQIMSGETSGSLFQGMGSYEILLAMGIPYQLVETVIPYVYDIFNLVWNAGVQILIFLAGLQTIPRQLYESASIEGCTPWESFWKITFPLMSPMIFMNLIYSIIDFCTTSTNPVIQLVNTQTSNMNFGYAAGLTWMYLLVVLAVVGIVYWLLSRRIVYMGE